MKCKNLEEFKIHLRKAIDTQSMEKFTSILRGPCPFSRFDQNHNPLSHIPCPDCPLSDINGPRELIEPKETCLLGSMTDVRSYRGIVDKEAILAKLVLMGIKLLAYLDSKE